MAYIYCADIYCDDCGEAIARDCRGVDDGDSDTFPQGPFPNGGGEADCPQHCGSGADCLNALEVDGHKVGAWLENDLTNHGVEYVRDAIAESRRTGQENAVVDYWAEVYSPWYGDILPAEVDDVEIYVERVKHSGAYICSAIVGDYLERVTYYDCTKAEAVSMFREHISEL